MIMTLESTLTYQPVPLRFGTSGRRGLVRDLTQLEVYINALAEIQYLLSLPEEQGGIRAGQEFYFASDLRPSSTAFDSSAGGRGEIAQAIEQAIRDAGLSPVFLGPLLTPALAWRGFSRRRGSIMITGSHIPFDRNGYKTNTARGELLKKDEAPIAEAVERARTRVHGTPADQSPFNQNGMFKTGHRELPQVDVSARQDYITRYVDFFGAGALKGLRLLVYEHSAVGREVLVAILKELGAEVFRAGRSEEFVPIDTENIDDAQLSVIRKLAKQASAVLGRLDAVVSMDGDSDRPLVLGVEQGSDGGFSDVRFYGGDLLGMVVAEYLGADAVVVPISCNDAIDQGNLKPVLEPKTRIGSPFVIAGMEQARQRGKRVVCGWEANGGFLTGSDILRNGRTLGALPTRDAMLPILSVLNAAVDQRTSIGTLFAKLPGRFSKAALLKNFARATSLEILRKFSIPDLSALEVSFGSDGPEALDAAGTALMLSPAQAEQASRIRENLSRVFNSGAGFGNITKLNYTDGLRICFNNGDVAHVRPSGNADELRIYAAADSLARAEAIAREGVAEPDGLLRRLAGA